MEMSSWIMWKLRSVLLCCEIVFCLVPYYCAQASKCHVNWINIHVTEVCHHEIRDFTPIQVLKLNVKKSLIGKPETVLQLFLSIGPMMLISCLIQPGFVSLPKNSLPTDVDRKTCNK